MKPIAYSLQFRGHAARLHGDCVRLRLSAPSAALVTTIGAFGVRGRFDDVSGGEATLDAQLSLGRSRTVDRGTIDFGRGNTVRFRSRPPRLARSPDPHLEQGAVIREVEGGKGQFAGAEGLITSNFLISDTGDVTDNHFGLIFIRDDTERQS